MVIDKWTRTSNNNLTIPLLGNKAKETFSELKKEYDRLRHLNKNYKKYSKESPPNNPLMNTGLLDNTTIKEYLSKIKSTLFTINEILSNNLNNGNDNITNKELKDINNITDQIISEYNAFLNNWNEIEIKQKTFEVNSIFYEIRVIISKINENLKKENNDDDRLEATEAPMQERRNLNRININIDRGHINFFSGRREFNNSITITSNNCEYSIEEEGLGIGMKLILYFLFILFLLFIIYLFIE